MWHRDNSLNSDEECVAHKEGPSWWDRPCYQDYASICQVISSHVSDGCVKPGLYQQMVDLNESIVKINEETKGINFI